MQCQVVSVKIREGGNTAFKPVSPGIYTEEWKCFCMDLRPKVVAGAWSFPASSKGRRKIRPPTFRVPRQHPTTNLRMVMPPTKRIYKGATTLFTLPGVRYHSTHTVVEESFLLQLLKLILFSVRQHGIYPAGDHGPGCHRSQK